MSACPPPQALRRLGDDSLGGAEFAEIEAHIADCGACRAALERLARLDPFEETVETLEGSTREGGRGLGAGTPSTPPRIPGFRVGAELGRGGCAVVYEAVQLQLGRRVALKILAGSPALDAGARARWLREARAIGRVRHPNVVRLHEAGEHEGWLYLVLDLVPGGSLADRPPVPMSPRVAAGLVETVARAVEQLHRDGLLHLDIKPSNILLDGPGGGDVAAMSPMLTDFGIALDEDEMGALAAASGTLGAMGTPAFMAPEQVAGPRRGIGPSADVFALGATLYALLTGRPPFQAASPVETLDLLRSREPAPPRALVPHLPRDLETICLACLQKDPARRYPSAGALADDLRRWLDGYPIRARPASRAEHALRWCRRHPAVSALAGLLGLTVLAALVGLTALWRRADAARARALTNEAAAAAAVRDLVGLLQATVGSPQRHGSEQLSDTLPVVLDLTAKLRRTPGLAAAHADAIASLEARLSEALIRGGGFADARRLLDDAADLLRVASGPDWGAVDATTAGLYAHVILQRGAMSVTESRLEEAAEDFRLADRAVEPHAGDAAMVGPLVGLYSSRIGLAAALAGRGDAEAAGRELDENDISFRRMSRRAPEDPSLGLIAALASFASSPEVPVTSVVAEALARFPEGMRLPTPLELLVDDLIAEEICAEASAALRRGDDPSAIAEAVVASLDVRLASLRGHPGAIEGIIRRLSQRGSLDVVASRRAGRLDEARATVGWMIALGHALQRRDPRSSGAHLLVCHARVQESKIAWLSPDLPAVERALRAALAEASIALDLDPADRTTRQDLAGLREKYVRLVTGEPDDE